MSLELVSSLVFFLTAQADAVAAEKPERADFKIYEELSEDAEVLRSPEGLLAFRIPTIVGEEALKSAQQSNVDLASELLIVVGPNSEIDSFQIKRLKESSSFRVEIDGKKLKLVRLNSEIDLSTQAAAQTETGAVYRFLVENEQAASSNKRILTAIRAFSDQTTDLLKARGHLEPADDAEKADVTKDFLSDLDQDIRETADKPIEPATAELPAESFKKNGSSENPGQFQSF